MATLSTIQEQTLPAPGTIYPDTTDQHYFKYLTENIGNIENNNEIDIQSRISEGCLKKVYTNDGLYTEGVPVEYINIIFDAITEIAKDDTTLDCMMWLVQASSIRVYLQPRNRISSGKKHIGNIWIFTEDGFVQLYMVKSN
jgi:hypothetical protein